MKKIITSTLLILISIMLYAQDEKIEVSFWEERGLWIKIIAAIVGAVFSAIFTYIFIHYREKRNQKNISYELKVKDGLVEIDDVIKTNTEISYKNINTKSLTLIECDFINSGKKLVKNYQLRFEATGKDIKIIESYFDPEPIMEYEVSEDSNFSKTESQLRYIIGHFANEKSVNFRFIVSGDLTDFKVHPKSEEGDVRLQTKLSSKMESDQETLTKVFLIIGILWFLPPILKMLITPYFADILKGIVYLVILVLLLPLIFRTSRIIASVILNLKRKDSTNFMIDNIQVNKGGSAYFVEKIGGNINHIKENESDQSV